MDAAIQEVRSYILDLRLATVPSHDLLSELAMLADTARSNLRLQTHLDLPSGLRSALSPELTEDLLYIAREAISNVTRHAEARSLRIRLSKQRSRIVLTISDDGKGFNPQETGRRAGDGIRNMQERVRRIGGELRIRSEAGGGTTMRVSVAGAPPTS
jgi:signal transduction histidine kinase